MANAAARGVAGGASIVNGEKRLQLVTKGCALGCDFCGTYSRPVGVACLHIANSSFPASVCQRCAAVLIRDLRAVLDTLPS
jgi:hypothetical protein